MPTRLFVTLNDNGLCSVSEVSLEHWLSQMKGVKVLSAASPFSATVEVNDKQFDSFVDTVQQLASVRKFRPVNLL